MAVADKTIDPRILESAKKEFLEKGFADASLKEICEKAGVTTGALYKRYSGKEKLFEAVVDPAVSKIYEMIENRTAPDLSQLSDEELIESWSMKEENIIYLFRFFYELRDWVTLLIEYSAGTKYHNFVHEFVLKLSKLSDDYYKEGFNRGLFTNTITPEEMHVLYSSYWTAMYEPIIHGMSWEQIERFTTVICKFFNWTEILGIEK